MARPWVRSFLALVVVGFLAAPVFSLQAGSFGADATEYLEIGRRMSVGLSYIAPDESVHSYYSHSRSPVYPILYSLSFVLLGASVNSALLVAKLFTFGSILVLYLLFRRLYNVRTALAIVALIVLSEYMIAFPAHLNIDQAMTFFMFLSLYLLVLSWEHKAHVLAVLAGIALGAGFGVKEMAILWLPLPAYLVLGVPDWRNMRNLVKILGFGIGFASIPATWWLCYYGATGEVFLLSRFDEVLPAISFTNVTLVLGILVVLGLSARHIGYRIYQRRILLTGPWIERARRLQPLVVGLTTWLLWFVVTFLFSIGMASRTGLPFRSADMGTITFSGLTTVAHWGMAVSPLLQLLGISLVLIFLNALLKKQRGDLVLLWCFLACIPLVVQLGMPARNVMQLRYGMLLFWLGLVAVGRSLVLATDFVVKLGSTLLARGGGQNLGQTVNGVLLSALVVYSAWTGRVIPKSHDYQQDEHYRIYVNDNVVSMLETSAWIEQNIPSHANIAANASHIRALEFFTRGEYNFYRLFSMVAERSDVVWPLESSVDLSLHGATLKLHGISAVSDDYRVHVPKPLYIQRGWVQTGESIKYATLSEEALIGFLKDYAIDYLVFAENPGYHGLNVIPDYFTDHPAFTRVFATQWRQNSDNYGLSIFRVDRSCLRETNYPVIVTSQTWNTLLDNASSLLGEDYDLFKVIEALGGGPIVLRPTAADNFFAYRQISEAYTAHAIPDLAAFQYHLALAESPKRVEALAETADLFTAEFSDCAGPWLLMGDVHRIKGDYQLSQKAYLRALSASCGAPISYAEAHRWLGEVILELGYDAEAKEQFESALGSSIFGGFETRGRLLFAQGNLYVASGDIERALAAYNQALRPKSEPSASNVQAQTPKSSPHFDFIERFNESRIVAPSKTSVHPAAFVVDNQAHPVLFAHPPSAISYTILVPPDAELHFAAVLAPAVWQMGKGDGVEFRIDLSVGTQLHYKLYSRYVDPKNNLGDRAWVEHDIDLRPWTGQTVTLTFITSPGPNDDDRYDWAGWGDARIMQAPALGSTEASRKSE